jgi:6-phosphogluconolactonase
MIHYSNLIIADDADHLAVIGAQLFRRYAQRYIERNGRFVTAISGGSTPRALHRLLACPPYLVDIPWQKIHLYWADDRLVPAEDPASNYGAARTDFLEIVSIPANQVHPVPSDKPPREAATEYQRSLTTCFENIDRSPRFDLIFLGIGQDGHTASIFPNDSSAVATDLTAVPVRGGKPDVARLTLTMPVLNSAACIVFIASGADKADIVGKILGGDAPGLPAARVRPNNGRTIWLLDRGAAARFCSPLKSKY